MAGIRTMSDLEKRNILLGVIEGMIIATAIMWYDRGKNYVKKSV